MLDRNEEVVLNERLVEEKLLIIGRCRTFDKTDF